MPGIKGTMREFKAGKLHSGSKKGPRVKSRSQAIAIGLSEERKMGHKVTPMRGKSPGIPYTDDSNVYQTRMPRNYRLSRMDRGGLHDPAGFPGTGQGRGR